MKKSAKEVTGETIVKLLIVICVVQVGFTIFLALKIFTTTKIKSVADEAGPDYQDDYKAFDIVDAENSAPVGAGEGEQSQSMLQRMFNLKAHWAMAKQTSVIEIWGKAALAMYIWQHILEGTEAVDKEIPGALSGEINLPKLILRFRRGPGITPETVSQNIRYLVLVLNGRTEDSVKTSRMWLDFIHSWKNPPRTIVMMLGNEHCENEWINSYVASDGPIKAVLLTYDDTRIDNSTFFQWPLGVATYRSFPVLNEEQVLQSQPRRYMCNLQATLYANSSRSYLHQILDNNPQYSSRCFVSVREKWMPTETPESMNDYVYSLIQSDLTLCPAGVNTETYRVYEAIAAGSIPVIEDVPSSGNCDRHGWRLLKELSPPLLWVSSWDLLPELLKKEQRLSNRFKIERRKKLFHWYEWFRLRLRDKFLSVLQKKLLY